MDVSTHRVRTKTARKAGSWGRLEVMSERKGREGHQATWEEKLVSRAGLELRIERGLSDQETLLEQRRQEVWRNHRP